MPQTDSIFQEFVSDGARRRIFEREALALEAAESISRLMEQQGVNKSELAARLGASKSHITSLLSGSRNITLHTFADLAFALGAKIEFSVAPLAGAPQCSRVDAQPALNAKRPWRPRTAPARKRRA